MGYREKVDNAIMVFYCACEVVGRVFNRKIWSGANVKTV